MDKLFTLLELQRRLFEAETRNAALHIILNDTKRVIDYTQAIYFSQDFLFLKAEKISGNIVLDPESDFIMSRQNLVSKELKNITQQSSVIAISDHDLNAVILILKTSQDGILGALWFDFLRPINEAEKIIFEEMAIVFSQSLALWQQRHIKSNFLHEFWTQRKKLIFIGFLIIFFFPTRLSLMAPAEIVPREAHIITVPFDGVVEDIRIGAGDIVKAGDVVAVMEHDGFTAQADLANQALQSAQSALSRLQREALKDPAKKLNLVELQEQVRTKVIERDYALYLKSRSEIRSDKGGVAIFDGEQNIRGKPVVTGDKIMMIANSEDVQLLLRVPVDSMIPVDIDDDVRFFLNINPLSSRQAKVKNVGYQSSLDSDGLLTYKIYADLDQLDKSVRIGWKGTARVQGDWTILGYSILRRPIITLRNLIGV